MKRAAMTLTIALALGAAACSNLGEDRLLSVSTTGFATGLVYLDMNGNRQPDAGVDSAMRNIRVKLVEQASGDSVAGDATDNTGLYEFDNVPVGAYRLVVNTTPFSDTVVVDRIDSSVVNVLPSDSTRVDVVVSYPRVSIAAARLLVPGKKVWLEGVVLNSAFAFRDTTMHLQDTSAAIRASRVFTVGLGAGDSLRLRGTTGRRAGQPTIDLVNAFPVATTFLPPAAVVTTAVAASAQNGVLDARQLQIIDVPITDTATVGSDFVLTVNDGSGALEVLLTVGPTFPFPPGPPTIPGQFIPGNRFDIVGLAVPTGVAGIWRLKPRSPQDLVRR